MVRHPASRRSLNKIVLLAGAAAFAGASALPGPAHAADPVVGPEIGSGQPVLVQFNTGFNPVASSDGQRFLVAFEDSSRIRAVRADGAGKVLDLSWLDFGEGALQTNAAIAFGDGH